MRVNVASIQPLGDRVLVRQEKEVERTEGGIVIPDTAKERPLIGHVLAVGTGRLLEDGTEIPLRVLEGSLVLFGRYVGTEIEVADTEERILILRQDEIFAVVKT